MRHCKGDEGDDDVDITENDLVIAVPQSQRPFPLRKRVANDSNRPTPELLLTAISMEGTREFIDLWDALLLVERE